MDSVIDIVAQSTSSHQTKAATALLSGLRKHGIAGRVVKNSQAVRSEFVACWGWRQGRFHRANGRQVLVMERAYLADRMHWLSLGWNGLNGRATFPKVADGGARWRKHFDGMLQPWRKKDGYALLLGQVPSDQAVKPYTDFRVWLNLTAYRLIAKGYEVKFRPHPGAPNVVCAHGSRSVGSLQDAFAGAAFAVTFNSNSGVDAVVAGIPTVTLDVGAMAYAVSSHDLLHPITTPDREAWAYNMAFTQWLPEEIAAGEAWEHLRSFVQLF